MTKDTVAQSAAPEVKYKTVFAVLAIAAAATIYAVAPAKRPSSDAVSADDARALVAEIGKLIVLPTNEDPTVATVVDPERLKDQQFFAQAKKGDRVLMYTDARKAILYRPDERRIVEVAPIAIGGGAEQ